MGTSPSASPQPGRQRGVHVRTRHDTPLLRRRTAAATTNTSTTTSLTHWCILIRLKTLALLLVSTTLSPSEEEATNSRWPGTCQDLIRRSDHPSQTSCMYVTECAAGNVTRTAPSRAEWASIAHVTATMCDATPTPSADVVGWE